MSLFARFVRFFTRSQAAPVMVRAPRTSESQIQSPSAIEKARLQLDKLRAEREGSWGETQHMKLD